MVYKLIRMAGTVCATLILASSQFLIGQTGIIRGTVLDESGRPLQGAKVHPEIQGKIMMMHSVVRYVETDENGSFAIDRLAFATYHVIGMKEEAGYPNLTFSFYAGQRQADSVEISQDHPAASIELKLGPRAGVLKGTVKDAVTGKPVPASFRLSAGATRWMSTSQPSNFRVLIPASNEITMEVSSPGYGTWVYGGTAAGSHGLRLESGMEKQINILLNPAFDKSAVASRYLIPKYFVGWLRVECDNKTAKETPLEENSRIFRFAPETHVLATSSPCPEDGAMKEYDYYDLDGLITPVPSDYWNGSGKIWGEYSGTRGGERRLLGFFVGTEEQFKASPNPPVN